MVSKIVQYAGLWTVPFHTYTTTYPAKNGVWNWNDVSMLPMEFWGYTVTPTNGSPMSGLYANITDFNTGYTKISVGDNNNSHTSATITENNGSPAVINNRMIGWTFGNNGAGTLYPGAYSYPAILGQDYSMDYFSPNYGFQLSNKTSNTNCPLAGLSSMPTSRGIAVGYEVQLNPFFATIDTANFIRRGNADTFNIGITNRYVNCVPNWNNSGVSWVQSVNPSSSTTRFMIASTDFDTDFNDIIQYDVQFKNPPGDLDVDTLLTTSNARGNATINGFLYFYKTTQTVEDKTFTGFAILIAPDYSFYYVINLVPTDGPSQNWASQLGTFEGKIDNSNCMFFKNANSANTLYVALNIALIVPLYYPVAIPDHGDDDLTLIMMRSVPT